MKPIYVFIGMIFLSASHAEARTLSLADLIHEGLSTSTAIRQSEAGLDAAKGERWKAYASMLPHVDAQYMIERTNDPVGVFSTKLQQGEFTAADFAIPSLNNPSSVTHNVVRAEWRQPLFQSGADWAQIKASNEGVTGATHMVAHSKESVTYQLTSLYYSLMAVHNQMAWVQKGEAMTRQLRRGYEPAQSPNSATESAMALVASVESDFAAMRESLGVAKTDIQHKITAIIGGSSDIEPAGALPEVHSNLACTMTTARHDVIAGEHQVNAASAMKQASQRRYGPVVDGVAGYSEHTGNGSQWNGAYDVGLRVTIPLFNSATIGEAKTASARYHRAIADQEEKRRYVTERQAALCESLRQVESEYAARQSSLSAAKRAMDVAMVRYADGSMSPFDVTRTIQNWVGMATQRDQTHLKWGLLVSEHAYQSGRMEEVAHVD